MVPLSGITCGPTYDICIQPTSPIGFYKSLDPRVHLPADCSFVTRPLHLPDLTTCPISNVMRYVVSLAGKIRWLCLPRSFAHCRRFRCQDWADAVPTADQITINGATNHVLMSSPDNILRQRAAPKGAAAFTWQLFPGHRTSIHTKEMSLPIVRDFNVFHS